MERAQTQSQKGDRGKQGIEKVIVTEQKNRD